MTIDLKSRSGICYQPFLGCGPDVILFCDFVFLLREVSCRVNVFLFLI